MEDSLNYKLYQMALAFQNSKQLDRKDLLHTLKAKDKDLDVRYFRGYWYIIRWVKFGYLPIKYPLVIKLIEDNGYPRQITEKDIINLIEIDTKRIKQEQEKIEADIEKEKKEMVDAFSKDAVDIWKYWRRKENV